MALKILTNAKSFKGLPKILGFVDVLILTLNIKL